MDDIRAAGLEDVRLLLPRAHDGDPGHVRTGRGALRRGVVSVSVVFEHGEPVDRDVLVLAARALGDLELDVDDLLQVGRRLGKLVQVQLAGVTVCRSPGES